jgi:hypothetical protein
MEANPAGDALFLIATNSCGGSGGFSGHPAQPAIGPRVLADLKGVPDNRQKNHVAKLHNFCVD